MHYLRLPNWFVQSYGVSTWAHPLPVSVDVLTQQHGPPFAQSLQCYICEGPSSSRAPSFSIQGLQQVCSLLGTEEVCHADMPRAGHLRIWLYGSRAQQGPLRQAPCAQQQQAQHHPLTNHSRHHHCYVHSHSSHHHTRQHTHHHTQQQAQQQAHQQAQAQAQQQAAVLPLQELSTNQQLSGRGWEQQQHIQHHHHHHHHHHNAQQTLHHHQQQHVMPHHQQQHQHQQQHLFSHASHPQQQQQQGARQALKRQREPGPAARCMPGPADDGACGKRRRWPGGAGHMAQGSSGAPQAMHVGSPASAASCGTAMMDYCSMMS